MERSCRLPVVVSEEFVAHGVSVNVNCLKIGKKTSGVIVTGGEDHRVNVWALGRTEAIMSLSGHSSAVKSVTFDNEETMVASGSASGSIKLWDLEEAKVVRSLTGHRSNCIAMDFHPFGEFFASGSVDTNLKIWDIRRKRCIHTYKGHDRGINVVKFSPDGRWVVSGGDDNVTKIWDLTAGKLMHEFTCHQGQILCLEFHPHEFLLATGSADKSVKFWDLETFELIGSAGPETSGVHSMIFNPDGRSLLAGFQEHMKVFSWEPLRCHDVVDVGWSKIADLNIDDGKLLGCSYNKSCVGIWVVDLSSIRPYALGDDSSSRGLPMIDQPFQCMVNGSLKSSNVSQSTSPSSVMSPVADTKPNATKIFKDEDQHEKPKERLCMDGTSIRRGYYVANVHNNNPVAKRDTMSMREHELRTSAVDTHSFILRRNHRIPEKSSLLTIDDATNIIEKLMEDHSSFTSSLQSRLTNLQVVRQFWIKNDLKGAVEAMGKMADQSVLVDVLRCWMERSELFTLEVCALLLPLLNGLLTSTVERYLSTALSVLLMIVKKFGHIIHTTCASLPALDIDFEAEERRKRCNECYANLQTITNNLTPLLRKGGDIGKAAQHLSVHLQNV